MARHPSLDDRHDPAIRIVDHDPRWADEARDELARIRYALGSTATRLEHIGSTAVPEMPAKPIIDLQVSVVSIDARDTYVGPLEQLGYLYAEDPSSPDRHFFAKPPERPRSHHVHVCQRGSRHELRHVAVRDFLRAHPAETVEYAALKRRLVARAPADRLAYIAGKDPYVSALEARAIAWTYQSAGPSRSANESVGPS